MTIKVCNWCRREESSGGQPILVGVCCARLLKRMNHLSFGLPGGSGLAVAGQRESVWAQFGEPYDGAGFTVYIVHTNWRIKSHPASSDPYGHTQGELQVKKHHHNYRMDLIQKNSLKLDKFRRLGLGVYSRKAIVYGQRNRHWIARSVLNATFFIPSSDFFVH